MRFLTRTFRNVFYVRVWKRHVRLWRSQRSRTNGRLRRLAVRRKLEDAWWCQSHVHCRRWRRGHAPGTQTEPQLEAATSAGVILPETGQFPLLCSLFLTHFTSVLYKQFPSNDTFLREANGYKRVLGIRNARQTKTFNTKSKTVKLGLET